MSEQNYAAMVDLAVQHLSLTDCPAQETVQLQVILPPRHFQISVWALKSDGDYPRFGPWNVIAPSGRSKVMAIFHKA